MSPVQFYLLLAYLFIDRLANASHHLAERLMVPLPIPFLPPISPPILNPSNSGEKRPASPSTPKKNCDNSQNCDAESRRIVFPKDCRLKDQNNQITAALKKVASNGQVYISMDDDCGGPLLWLLKIKSSHIPEILKIPNVEAVEMDVPLDNEAEKVSDAALEKSVQSVSSNLELEENNQGQDIFEAAGPKPSQGTAPAEDSGINDPNDTLATEIASSGAELNPDELQGPILTVRDALPRSHKSTAGAVHNVRGKHFQHSPQLEKRASGVARQRSAPRALNFISTPAGARSPDYLYPAGPYESITIYSVDFGVEAKHSEFLKNKVIKNYLYTPDLPEDARTQTDSDAAEGGHGTCALSVTCGEYFGVFKKPNVVVVKTPRWIGSALTAYQTVLNDLIHRAKEPDSGPVTGPIKGYTVLSLHGLVGYPPASYAKRLIRVFKLLIELFEVVVVSPAGNNAKFRLSIEGYPSVLSRRFPIIVAGSVDLGSGERSENSQEGQFLTVSAPGTVECAAGYPGSDMMIFQGTSFASAATAGVAALLLGDKRFGRLLRISPLGVTHAVKACIVELAQQRGTDGHNSVWTGLDFRKPGENYQWPPLHLKCLQGVAVSLEDTNIDQPENT